MGLVLCVLCKYMTHTCTTLHHTCVTGYGTVHAVSLSTFVWVSMERKDGAVGSSQSRQQRNQITLCASSSPLFLSDLTMSEKVALESKLQVLTDEVTRGTLSFATRVRRWLVAWRWRPMPLNHS